ncbi:MAG: histidinol-phosphate transaminase, partial [Candidatus Firestonebacteria bacterium RifOxyC12_full_39_7]
MKKLQRDAIDKLSPYIPGKPVAEVQRELGISDVIKMASNENPLGASPKAVAAVKKAAEQVYFYPEGSCFELRKAVAEHLQIPADNLIFGNGSDELLLLISQVFLNPGDEVLQGDPKLTFVEYKAVTTIADAKPVIVEMKDFGYDLKTMAEKFTNKTKIVFITNPNNPTGTMITKDELDEFFKKVPEDVIVVLDEAYYEYVGRADYPESVEYVKEGKNVIILRTFSKIYGLAGLRLGYGIARKELIELLGKARQPFNVNLLAQSAGIAALKDIKFVEESKHVNNEGKIWIGDALEAMGITFVRSEANFILFDVKVDAKPVTEALMKEGIIVRCIGTGTTIRVTIGTMEQNRRFIG